MLQPSKLEALKPQRIVVLRALQLGDMLTSIPAFRSLRAALPDSFITLVGLPWAQTFTRRFPYYFDDFIEFPGFPGLPEIEPNLSSIPKFISDVQWLEYDLAIQMHGSGAITNSLTALFNTRRSSGFYLPGQYQPDGELFMPYPAVGPELRRCLKLVEFLGAEPQGEVLEFPLQTEDWEELNDLIARHNLTAGDFACIHPGSRSPERRWPAEYFAQIADALAARGLRIVLTGSHQEVDLAESVAAQMEAPALNLAGQTSLGGIAALLCKARLLVTNDTGVSHLADALRVPSLVLFTTSDPIRRAPLDQKLHRVVAWSADASPTVVIKEADSLLDETVPHAG